MPGRNMPPARWGPGRVFGRWRPRAGATSHREGPWRCTRRRRKPEATRVPDIAPEIRQVMRAVSRYVPVETVRLPDAFLPAHLSVAIIDAVYGFRLEGDEPPPSIAERYCRHFGLVRTRADQWQPPPVHDQETLRDLVGHYDSLGAPRYGGRSLRGPRPVPREEPHASGLRPATCDRAPTQGGSKFFRTCWSGAGRRSTSCSGV